MRTAITDNSFWALFIPVIIIFSLFIHFRIAGDDWKYVVDSDGRGYYHYLVEYLVRDEFRDVDEENTYLAELEGKRYNRYTLGTSLLLLPFFGLGYAISIIGDYTPDGFSWPFQLMAGLGALFYLIVGGWFLYRLMLSYRCSRKQAWVIALIAVFGTNLLYYGVIASTMSHVFSFATIAAFAFTTRKFFLSGDIRYLLLTGALFGLVVLIRPFNGLVILTLPLFFVDKMTWKVAAKKIVDSWIYVLLAGAISILLFVPQIIAWHDQTGIWMLYGYSKMGFYFANPQIIEVLLGFNKGLFIYTPLMLLPVVASFMILRRHPSLAAWFIAFFFLLTYLISSWWCWNYASGFGMRPYIDFFAIFAIPVGLFISRLSASGASQKKYRWLLIPIAALTILNLLQCYQYRAHILHPNNMNFEKYQYVFLKTGESYENSLGGNFDLPPYPRLNLRPIEKFEPKLENDVLMDEFLYTRHLPNELLPDTTGFIHWKIELAKSDLVSGASNELYFVVEYSVFDSTTVYSAFKVNDMPDYPVSKRIRHNHSLTLRMPAKNELVKFYLWNKDLQPILIAEYSATIVATKE